MVEEALSKSDQRFQQVVESAPNGMVMVDEAGKIHMVNKAAEVLFGWSREELLEMNVDALVPQRYRGRHPQHRMEFHKDPKVRSLGAGRDLYGLKKDGSEVPIEIGLNPIEIETGRFVLASIVDIRERKKAQDDIQKKAEELKRSNQELEQFAYVTQKTNEGIKMLYKELEKKNKKLEQRDQLKNDFVNNVSHELRTPLTIIRESISQVVDGLFGETNEKQNTYLNKSLISIDRLKKIIDDLLNISKIEKRKTDLYKQNVNVVEMMEEIVADFTPLFQKKNLGITCRFDKKKINCLADKEKIIQVLTNLINNAYKFTEKGYVEIGAVENGANIECRVRDTGIGIAADDLPRLFSKFEQIGRQDGPGEKGTGLGLTIVKGIIELHDGKISVESMPGQGTTFTFTLPKYPVEEEEVRDLLKCLENISRKYKDYSVLSVGIKEFEEQFREVLNDLDVLIKEKLYRKPDLTVKGKRSVYLILPDTSKDNAMVVAARIRRMINERNWQERVPHLKGFCLSVVNYPQDGLTEEELVAKLETDKAVF